jgi:hypothetical protein
MPRSYAIFMVVLVCSLFIVGVTSKTLQASSRGPVDPLVACQGSPSDESAYLVEVSKTPTSGPSRTR